MASAWRSARTLHTRSAPWLSSSRSSSSMMPSPWWGGAPHHGRGSTATDRERQTSSSAASSALPAGWLVPLRALLGAGPVDTLLKWSSRMLSGIGG